jgi:hypothetical protein
MDFRTGHSHARVIRSACRIAVQRRMATRRKDASDFCRRPKTRVIAIPISLATRYPQCFAAGFSFRSIQPALVDLSELGRDSAPQFARVIDWRICGEQDANAEEQSHV